MCFNSYKNHKLKVKLGWVGARERKKRTFFVPFILSEGNFLKICISSQWIVYWMQFQNIHTFTIQKTLLHTLLLLVFKIVESLQCTLKVFSRHFNTKLLFQMKPFYVKVLSKYQLLFQQFGTCKNNFVDTVYHSSIQ